jgi:hypothetical protein
VLPHDGRFRKKYDSPTPAAKFANKEPVAGRELLDQRREWAAATNEEVP